MSKFLIITIFLCLKLICTTKYEDTKEAILRRLEYGRNHSLNITGGKIDFDYSEHEGVYCKASQNLYEKEFVFKIPGEHIICSFDMFPYKFELKNPVENFIVKKYVKTPNEIHNRKTLYLFSFGMMFVDYQNKSQIFEFLKKSNKDYYIIQYSSKVLEYLETLPRVFYTPQAWSSDERKLQEYLGIPADKNGETREVWEHTIGYVEENYKEFKDYILPWISDFDKFNFFVNAISSRGYKIIVQEYEKLLGKSIASGPMGEMHKKMYSNKESSTGTCLIPFIDLCNHRNPKDHRLRDKIDFLTVIKQGEILFAFTKEFQKGENYEYSYLPFAPNEVLIMSYGFYVANNPHSITSIYFNLKKEFFPKSKHDLCNKLNLLEKPFPELYETKHLLDVKIPVYLGKNELNKKILNTLKVYFSPMKKFDDKYIEKIEKRMEKGKWITYDNEILSLSFYRMTINNSLSLLKLKPIDIIYSIHNTRQYFKANREEIIKEPNTRYIYRLRRKIMELARENMNILTMQIRFTNKEIKYIISDQFRKLRNHIINEN